eukprot:11138429-Alexandrium_andersonii.AAC.1
MARSSANASAGPASNAAAAYPSPERVRASVAAFGANSGVPAWAKVDEGGAVLRIFTFDLW